MRINKMKQVCKRDIILVALMIFSFELTCIRVAAVNVLNKSCELLKPCRVGPIHLVKNLFNRQFLYSQSYSGMICEPTRHTSFTLTNQNWLSDMIANADISCLRRNKRLWYAYFDLKLPPSRELILTNKNTLDVIRFLLKIYGNYFHLQISNARGLHLELNNSGNSELFKMPQEYHVNLIESGVEFYYANAKRIESCEDLMKNSSESNRMLVVTIFQLVPIRYLLFLNCHFK